MSISDEELALLDDKANRIREDIIKMLVEAGSGHSAGSLGTADIFTALYFHVMKHDPKNPEWEERDRFVLSNAHICPVLYTTLAHAGYYPKREMMTLRKYGSRLQCHPHRGVLPGVEASGGPLAKGYQWLLEWLWRIRWMVNDEGFIACLEMENRTKDKFGRRLCLPEKTSLIM